MQYLWEELKMCFRLMQNPQKGRGSRMLSSDVGETRAFQRQPGMFIFMFYYLLFRIFCLLNKLHEISV